MSLSKQNLSQIWILEHDSTSTVTDCDTIFHTDHKYDYRVSKTVGYAKSVTPDEVVYHEPPHLDIHCLPLIL